jgi:HTH-type transcriptional regulator/antitoxin MqsA
MSAIDPPFSETTSNLRRDIRPFVVCYAGRQKTVDLPGFYPVGRGDGIHVGDDMQVVDAALRELKAAG